MLRISSTRETRGHFVDGHLRFERFGNSFDTYYVIGVFKIVKIIYKIMLSKVWIILFTYDYLNLPECEIIFINWTFVTNYVISILRETNKFLYYIDALKYSGSCDSASRFIQIVLYQYKYFIQKFPPVDTSLHSYKENWPSLYVDKIF